MSDEDQIGAVIDEMYAMISGPAGPRDWSRQRNSFLPEARQVRTWVDEQGRPAMKMMGLDEYAANTTAVLQRQRVLRDRDRRAASTSSATWRTSGAIMKRGARPMTLSPNGAASIPSSCSATPIRDGGSSR